MERFKLYSDGLNYIRYLGETGLIHKRIYIYDCVKGYCKYDDEINYAAYQEATEDQLFKRLNVELPIFEECDSSSKKIARERYNLISSILPFIEDAEFRTNTIKLIANKHGISQQTVRKYLKTYLTYTNISSLLPYLRTTKNEMTQEQKAFRWALNKFYYTSAKHSLFTAYELMLKEKYTNTSGALVDNHPPFHKFIYFYRKHKRITNQLISRDGLTNYQRNHRPLLGHIDDYAPHPGLGMVDATILDIYLVNDSGQLVGRPYLYLMVDAYSSMILGYYLGWKGGIYGIRQMLQNCISDKVEHCAKFGVEISKEQWDVHQLPLKIMSDRGKDFFSSEFSQLTDLGIEIINAPSYRAELKGPVEKAFDLLQRMFKPHLQRFGVVNPDYQERGVRDYRKDAKLTINQLEMILVRCIVAYNTTRLVKLPYIKDINIKPFAYFIYNDGLSKYPNSFIDVDDNYLNLILLPRVDGSFTRNGLKVFKLYYRRAGINERILGGGKVQVAFNPENTSNVWLYENGKFLEFSLIDNAYGEITFEQANELKKTKTYQFKEYEQTKIQGDLDLITSISIIKSSSTKTTSIDTSNVRNTRVQEISKNHKRIITKEDANDD